MNEQEIATMTAKAAPSVAVSATTTIFGVPLPDMVLYATLIYTALQIFFLLRDKLRKRRKSKADRDE